MFCKYIVVLFLTFNFIAIIYILTTGLIFNDFLGGATSATMVFFDEILLSRMPLKSSLIVVKNAPILLAQLETGHMSVALMRGRQAKQSPNPNIHSTSTTAYMSKRGKQQGGALHKIL